MSARKAFCSGINSSLMHLQLIVFVNNSPVSLNKMFANSNMWERLRHGMKFPKTSSVPHSTLFPHMFPKLLTTGGRGHVENDPCRSVSTVCVSLSKSNTLLCSFLWLTCVKTPTYDRPCVLSDTYRPLVPPQVTTTVLLSWKKI